LGYEEELEEEVADQEEDKSKKGTFSKVTLEEGEVDDKDEPVIEVKSKDSKLKSAKSKVEFTAEATADPDSESKAESKIGTVEKLKPKLTPRIRVPKIKNNEPKSEAKLTVIPEGSKESKEPKSKLKSAKSAPEALPLAEPKESKKLKSKDSKAETKPENAVPSAPRKLKTKAP
jgi:hypothetical protein